MAGGKPLVDSSEGKSPRGSEKIKPEPKEAAQDKSDPGTPKTMPGDFTFTPDQLGKRLAKYLPPEQASIKTPDQNPKRPAGPDWLERPEVAMPAFQGMPIKPTSPRRPALQPVNPREDVPGVNETTTANLPEPVKLPSGPLARQPGVDLEGPLPLPILAQPTPDRASLGDPSLEASLVAALINVLPTRTLPVPFMAFNLPNPFEFHGSANLRTPPPEEPLPPIALPRTPTK